MLLPFSVPLRVPPWIKSSWLFFASLRGSKAVKPFSVSGNWRVTFRFEDGHAVEVDYTDYH